MSTAERGEIEIEIRPGVHTPPSVALEASSLSDSIASTVAPVALIASVSTAIIGFFGALAPLRGAVAPLAVRVARLGVSFAYSTNSTCQPARICPAASTSRFSSRGNDKARVEEGAPAPAPLCGG